MKRIYSLFLALLCIITILKPIPAQACANTTPQEVQSFIQKINEIYSQGYPKGQVTFTNIKEAVVLCGMCSTSKTAGSIGIAKLTDKQSYIVVLGGTELNPDENNGILEDLLSACNLQNKYLESCLKILNENIPYGSNLYIYGYSLGGMVLQQVLADKQFKQNYHVQSAVAIGSPIITVKRIPIIFIEDSLDIVPKCSFSSLFIKRHQNYDIHINRVSEVSTFIGAHALSYIDSPVWDDIDVCGISNGQNSIQIDMDSFTTYFC